MNRDYLDPAAPGPCPPVPGFDKSFGWGHLKDHPEPCDECSATGENEDGEECDVCGGACCLRWGSFYGDDPRGECEFCGASGVVTAAMYEDNNGREWVCLPCYVTHHKETCGCDLWRAAEAALQPEGVGDP